MDEGTHLWLDEDRPPTRARGRTAWIVAASVACIAAISVPVALGITSGGGRVALPPVGKQSTHPHPSNVAAQRVVESALSATTSSGSFNVTYEFDPGGATTDPTTSSGVTGQGTIDTDPFAMVATSDVSSLGMITLRDNGTDVWEMGGADYELSHGSGDTGPGSPLSGFAGLVESTLGQREGALAMGGLSSPTGYLDLDQSMITSADEVGTGTVDGAPVTIYQLSITPAQAADVPRLTSEESQAITASDAVLAAQGYTGSTVDVSIDVSGFIRQTNSVAHFADGSTSSSEATFSDFGCAGTVLMPGQSGATAPPAGCVSPATGVAPTTTSTSSATSTTSTPSSTSSTTSTTSSTTTTTSAPPSTTTSS